MSDLTMHDYYNGDWLLCICPKDVEDICCPVCAYIWDYTSKPATAAAIEDLMITKFISLTENVEVCGFP